MTPFSQEAWACRCEWSVQAVAALAPADVTIIVDVHSFTTCIDVATARGVAILPYAWNDATAAAFALAVSAGGACRAVTTTSLLSVEEGIAAMRKAATAEYRPPEHYDYRVG